MYHSFQKKTFPKNYHWDAYGVMVAVIVNGYGNLSSIPGWVCISYSESMNPNIIIPAMAAGQTGLFNPGMATGLGEGKLNSNLLNFA